MPSNAVAPARHELTAASPESAELLQLDSHKSRQHEDLELFEAVAPARPSDAVKYKPFWKG
jgi:hypothetical protein